MGKRIGFSMAWLDKETFITGACLWPKVLQDMIYSLEVFSSWSLPPTPHPPKKKLESAVESRSLWQPRAVCTHSWGYLGTVLMAQRMYVHWPVRSQWLICDRHVCPLAQDSAWVLLSIPAAAPGHVPPLKFVGDEARDRDLLSPLQIFNQIAAVMICIYCSVFLQINLSLK